MIAGKITPLVEIPKRDKLHDISDGPVSSVAKQLVVGVKRVHGIEVSIADSDDNDAHRKVRSGNDGVHRVRHIRNNAVGDDE